MSWQEEKREEKQRKQIFRKRQFNRDNPKWREKRNRKSLQRKLDISREASSLEKQGEDKEDNDR